MRSSQKKTPLMRFIIYDKFHMGYQLGSLDCDFDHEMRFIMQRNGITLPIYFMFYYEFLTKESLSLKLCNRKTESFVFIYAQLACLRFIFNTAHFFRFFEQLDG